MEMPISKPQYQLDEYFYQKVVPELKKKNIYRFGLRRCIAFLMDGYRLSTLAVKKRWGIDIYFFHVGHGLTKSVYLDNKINEEAAKIWWAKMNSEKNFMRDLIEEVANLIIRGKKLAKSIPQKNLTPKQAEYFILEFGDYWVKFFEPSFLWFCVEIIKEKIDQEITANFEGPKEELTYFLANVYRPIKWPKSSVEQRDLLKVGLLKGKAQQVALKKHWQKYSHLNMHDSIGDNPFTLEDFQDRLKIMEQKEEYTKLKNTLDSAHKELKLADQLLRKAKLPEKLKEKINFVRSFMYLRTESIDYITMIYRAYKNVFNSLGKIFDLPGEAVLQMTFEEIISSLQQKKLVIDRSIILDRNQNGYAYLITPTKSYFVKPSEIDKLWDLVDPQRNDEKPSELKGQIAYAGKARGLARVIIDSQKANEIKNGEILITTMTNPSYVPAMKKSAGVITNEGGVLCHAAIISRELGKPCLIGTKFATDVFKTGDLIELDAENGIAKKIEQ